MGSVSKTPYVLKYGLALGLLNVIFATVSNFSGLTESGMIGTMVGILFFLFVPIFIFYLAYKAFRSDNGGMSFGQGLGIAALISAISGLITGIYNFVYKKLIDPGLLERTMEKQYELMESFGLSDEEIEQQMQGAELMMQYPILEILGGILAAVCFGFFISLIMSAIMQEEKTPDWLNDPQTSDGV